MARSAASYGAGALHKTAFSDEALFRSAPQYEASPQCFDMKHSLCLYDERNER